MVTSTISLMVPGWVAMTTMRSARKIDSEMLWVTKTTVFLSCSQMRSSSSCITSRVWASRAPKGSSMRSTEGWLASTRAMATRCFMPPESSRGYFSSCSARPTRERSRQALDHGAELHVLDGGAPGKERVLLEHHPAVGSGLRHLVAVHEDVAGGGLDEARDHVEQGGLATARG